MTFSPLKFIRALGTFLLLVCALPSHGQEVRRQEKSIFPLNAVEGHWSSENIEIAIAGRLFRKGGRVEIGHGKDRDVLLSSSVGYDVFESYVGVQKEDNNGSYALTFSVLGDGNLLWTSPRLSPQDKAVRVSVPIQGFSALTLRVTNVGSDYCAGVWGDPVFVKFTRVAPPTPDYVPPTVSGSDPLIFGGEDVLHVDRNIDVIKVFVNGQEVNFASAPILTGGRLLVPVREIFEALGAKVTYNPGQAKIDAERNGQRISLQLGSNLAVVNNRAVTLDVPARAYYGRTMVPLRFISESFGVRVTFG